MDKLRRLKGNLPRIEAVDFPPEGKYIRIDLDTGQVYIAGDGEKWKFVDKTQLPAIPPRGEKPRILLSRGGYYAGKIQ